MLLSDFRLAVRQFTKAPAFTAVVVATLALGIGATTTIFSLVNTTFLRPLPYPDAERLVFLNEGNPRSSWMSVSYPDFLDWHAQQDVFSSLALYRVEQRTLKTADLVEQVPVVAATADFFDVLGVAVRQGRPLASTDDQPGAPLAVWLTHSAWLRHFAAKPDIVGESISLSGKSYAVAGILPDTFRFPRQIDFVVALAPQAAGLFMLQRQNHNDAYGLGRLKPGVTLEQARTQLTAIGQRIAEQYPESNKGVGPTLTPLRERLTGNSRSPLFLLLGAVGLLLLLTCVNVANMLLVRSFSRDREMAVRTALGASRRQLVGQLLIESLLFAAAGGVLGCLFGLWGQDLALRLVPAELISLDAARATLDGRMLAFVLGITLLTGVGFGLAPAWRSSHTNPNDAMKNPGALTTWLGRVRVSDLLVVAQVALALMLLIGAGLLIRSLHGLTQVNPGFRAAQLLTVQIAPPAMADFGRDPMGVGRDHLALVERLRNLPGVESAAFADSLPYSGTASWMTLFRLDRPVPAPGEFQSGNAHCVSPDYFRTMGIPLIAGRLHNGHEPVPAMPPGTDLSPENISAVYQNCLLDAVISQRMAERFWPGENPIGKRFQLGFPAMRLPVAEVVGVVGNTSPYGLDRDPPPEFYLSLRQFPAPNGAGFVLRSPLDAAALAPMVRTAVQETIKDRPILAIKTMTARLDDSVGDRRFNMILFTSFAAIALMLAVLGIYGVLAFVVTRRTREFGIRLALGAQRRHVLRSVIWRGFGLVLLGAAIGLGGAWALSRLLQSQLYGITRTDPLAYLAGAGLLLLAALVACLIPARRATQVDPISALRVE